jgi:hypothetical protein
MASQVLMHLVLEGFRTSARSVPNNRSRFVLNHHSRSKHSIPKLRVLAASSGSRAQTLVENPNPDEIFSAEGHIRACPDPPDGNSFRKRALKEKRVKKDRTISAVKAPKSNSKRICDSVSNFFASTSPLIPKTPSCERACRTPSNQPG